MNVSDTGALPVHGFVLAGGASSRMGQDKALLVIQGQPMVASAVHGLQRFCSRVSIAGNRDDLACFTSVVHEVREHTGPAAGMEAALVAAAEDWALFCPVDVPLMPVVLLRRWAEASLVRAQTGVRLSFLRVHGEAQPTFCLLHRSCAKPFSDALNDGERKLARLFARVADAVGAGSLWAADAEAFAQDPIDNHLHLAWQFSNINTPGDLTVLESYIEMGGSGQLAPEGGNATDGRR